MNSDNSWPAEGFVRLGQIIGTPNKPGPIPISRALWYQLLRAGAVPQPVLLGQRLTAYRVHEVRQLMDDLQQGETFTDLTNRWPRQSKEVAEADGDTGPQVASHKSRK